MNKKDQELLERKKNKVTIWSKRLLNKAKYGAAILGIVTTTSCGDDIKKSPVTEASEKYDIAIQNTEDKKEIVNEKAISLEEAQKELQEAQKKEEDALRNLTNILEQNNTQTADELKEYEEAKRERKREELELNEAENQLKEIQKKIEKTKNDLEKAKKKEKKEKEDVQNLINRL